MLPKLTTADDIVTASPLSQVFPDEGVGSYHLGDCPSGMYILLVPRLVPLLPFVIDHNPDYKS